MEDNSSWREDIDLLLGTVKFIQLRAKTYYSNVFDSFSKHMNKGTKDRVLV